MEINLLPWREAKARRKRYYQTIIILVSLIATITVLSFWDFGKSQRLAKITQQNNLLQMKLQSLPGISAHVLAVNQLATAVLDYRYNMQQMVAAIAQATMHGTCFNAIKLQAQNYQFHGQAVSLSALDKLVRTWPAVLFFPTVVLQNMQLASDGAVTFVLQAAEKHPLAMGNEHA